MNIISEKRTTPIIIFSFYPIPRKIETLFALNLKNLRSSKKINDFEIATPIPYNYYQENVGREKWRPRYNLLLFGEEERPAPKGTWKLQQHRLEKKRGCSLIRAALINRGRLLKVVRTPRRGPPTRPFSFSFLFLFVILPSLRFLRPAKIARAEHDPNSLLLILYIRPSL